MKEFKTHRGEFIAVKVPSDAQDFALDQKPNGTRLCKFTDKWSWEWLPKGNYEIIGLVSEIEKNEELAKSVVSVAFDTPRLYHGGGKCIGQSLPYARAFEAFQSLMKSLEIYTVNPYGEKHPSQWEYTLESMHKEPNDIALYEQAKQNTGEHLILKKI